MLTPNEIFRLINSNKKLVTFQVNGFSMIPLVNEGDKITVKKIESSEIEFGDLVAFYVNDNFVIHRIVKIIKNENGIQFWEKGDNRKFPTLINENQIVGKVVEIQKSNKTIFLDLKSEKLKSKIYATFSYFDYLKNTLLNR